MQHGLTALHMACQKRHTEVVSQLLKAGADLTVRVSDYEKLSQIVSLLCVQCQRSYGLDNYSYIKSSST